jgi:hypothetical protein
VGRPRSVGHLLHDQLRRLSGTRDGHAPAWASPDGDLARAVHRANEEFVEVARQISRPLLADLIAHLGPQLDELWSTLDLSSFGASVSWVEPGVDAPVWLDVAREFTDFWVHQQQIRDAVGLPGAVDAAVSVAVVDTLIRSLPRALAGTAAAPGSAVTLTVLIGTDLRVTCTARRLATRGQTPAAVAPDVPIDGDPSLATAALTLLSVIR